MGRQSRRKRERRNGPRDAAAGFRDAMERITKQDDAKERARVKNQVGRIVAGIDMARRMVPRELALLHCAVPEVFEIDPAPCVQCQDRTRNGGAVILARPYQEEHFDLPDGVVVTLLVPLCEGCTRRYQADPSSLDDGTLDRVIARFWECGTFLTSAEDKRTFPWLLELIQDTEDEG
jgi:hypothetical protein